MRDSCPQSPHRLSRGSEGRLAGVLECRAHGVQFALDGSRRPHSAGLDLPVMDLDFVGDLMFVRSNGVLAPAPSSALRLGDWHDMPLRQLAPSAEAEVAADWKLVVELWLASALPEGLSDAEAGASCGAPRGSWSQARLSRHGSLAGRRLVGDALVRSARLGVQTAIADWQPNSARAIRVNCSGAGCFCRRINSSRRGPTGCRFCRPFRSGRDARACDDASSRSSSRRRPRVPCNILACDWRPGCAGNPWRSLNRCSKASFPTATRRRIPPGPDALRVRFAPGCAAVFRHCATIGGRPVGSNSLYLCALPVGCVPER